MAQCAVDCYSGTDYNSIHKCVDQCQQSLQGIGKQVEGELKAMQSSVQACQQSVVSRLQPQMQAAQQNPEAQKGLQQEYEAGFVRCLKEAEPTLPDIEKRISG